MEEIILASSSPRRRELMGLLGLPFRVLTADTPEQTDRTEPGEVVEALASLKAEAVAARLKSGLVVGSDTIVVCDGEILGKPSGHDEAHEMLGRLQGRAHEVYTGVCLIRISDGERRHFHERTRVCVHAMDEAEIGRYLETGDAYDKAGAYGIQGPFAAHVDAIEGDYYTVMGLPVAALYRQLKDLGCYGSD